MSKVELFLRRNNHAARDKEVPDLSKVELFPRRNSVVFLASDCFSKVEFFLRRNITVLLSAWPSSSFFSVVGEGVTEV